MVSYLPIMVRDKKICFLYSKQDEFLGEGFWINLGKDECFIASRIVAENAAYAKFEKELIVLPNDWLFLDSLDIGILKLVKKVKGKRTKNENKSENDFTELDFQNALKKASKKVSKKK